MAEYNWWLFMMVKKEKEEVYGRIPDDTEFVTFASTWLMMEFIHPLGNRTLPL